MPFCFSTMGRHLGEKNDKGSLCVETPVTINTHAAICSLLSYRKRQLSLKFTPMVVKENGYLLQQQWQSCLANQLAYNTWSGGGGGGGVSSEQALCYVT